MFSPSFGAIELPAPRLPPSRPPPSSRQYSTGTRERITQHLVHLSMLAVATSHESPTLASRLTTHTRTRGACRCVPARRDSYRRVRAHLCVHTGVCTHDGESIPPRMHRMLGPHPRTRAREMTSRLGRRVAWITRDGQDLSLPPSFSLLGVFGIHERLLSVRGSFSLHLSFLLASPVERLTAFFSGWLRARPGAGTPSTRRWIRSRAALTTSRVGTVTTGSEEDLPTSSRSRSRLEDTRRRVRRSRVDAINFPIRASLPVNDACRLATSDLSPIFVR